MPYILNKTNGAALVTVSDGGIDESTSLTFVGRNYSGYGEIVNENFLKLLENFSNTSAPAKPLPGQLWFDIGNRRLNLSYDGKNYKPIANIRIQGTTPDSSITGDLWWDTDTRQLKAYDGTSYQLVGPPTSSVAKSSFDFVEEQILEEENVYYAVIKGLIGYNPVAVFSKEEFTPVPTSNLDAQFEVVKKGITIPGADANTGVSTSTGFYFWGTAAHALKSDTATTVTITSQPTGLYYLPFANTTTGDVAFNATSSLSYDVGADLLNATAVNARFADLAERYAADDAYQPGTVLVIGGEKEVTICKRHGDPRVAGVVSTKPAYTMNGDAGSDETHPFIALKGRVPCKVVGQIRKGDFLVTSTTFGHAERYETGDHPLSIIGKALENFNGDRGIIEIMV